MDEPERYAGEDKREIWFARLEPSVFRSIMNSPSVGGAFPRYRNMQAVTPEGKRVHATYLAVSLTCAFAGLIASLITDQMVWVLCGIGVLFGMSIWYLVMLERHGDFSKPGAHADNDAHTDNDTRSADRQSDATPGRRRSRW